MGLLDAPVRSAVKSVIGALKTYAVLERSRAMYDPINGVEGATGKIKIRVPVSPPLGFTSKEVDGTTILATDTKFLVAAKGLPTGITEIKADEYDLVFGSRRFRVVGTRFVDAGEEHAMMILQCRK